MGDKPVGGIFEMKGPGFDGVPENCMPYLAVDDIDSRAKKAVAAGATLMRPLFDIPATAASPSSKSLAAPPSAGSPLNDPDVSAVRHRKQTDGWGRCGFRLPLAYRPAPPKFRSSSWRS